MYHKMFLVIYEEILHFKLEDEIYRNPSTNMIFLYRLIVNKKALTSRCFSILISIANLSNIHLIIVSK